MTILNSNLIETRDKMDEIKLDGKSMDMTKYNLDSLRDLFPEVFEDGKINFDKLKLLLGDQVLQSQEAYELTWSGKNESIYISQTPSLGTLRPCRKDSVNWETTNNLYIEGDNLEVLKLLQKSYFNSIKMIYIDPPYNTGNDFVYNDDFSDNILNYKIKTNQVDSDGNKLSANSETNGRYHTKWLNMIYPRIKLARSLLKREGIIFISIDDNEVANLRKICDEIFGPSNFIAQIIIDGTPKNDPKIVSTSHEYCLVYVKNMDVAKTKTWGSPNPIYGQILDIWKGRTDYDSIQRDLYDFYSKNDLLGDNISNYKYADSQGVYRIGPIDDPQGNGPRDIRLNKKTGNALKTPSSGWRCNLETWNEWVNQGLIEYPDTDDKLCAKKTYIKPDQLDLLRSYIKIQTRKDTDNLKRLFGGKKVFSFPKPLEFVSNLIRSCTSDGDTILDFFGGSSTTAHATIYSSLEDKKNLNFIIVQLPEDLEYNYQKASGNREKKVLKDAIDYCRAHNYPLRLTEIGKERIRLAAADMGLFNSSKQQTLIDSPKIDYGFRVFKLDESNIKQWAGSTKDLENTLLYYEDNIRTDDSRTDEDIIFELLLKLGLKLNTNIKLINSNGYKIYTADFGALMICLDDISSTDIADELINLRDQMRPEIWKVVLTDRGFGKNNSLKANIKHTLQRAGLKEDSFLTL